MLTICLPFVPLTLFQFFMFEAAKRLKTDYQEMRLTLGVHIGCTHGVYGVNAPLKLECKLSKGWKLPYRKNPELQSYLQYFKRQSQKIYKKVWSKPINSPCISLSIKDIRIGGYSNRTINEVFNGEFNEEFNGELL